MNNVQRRLFRRYVEGGGDLTNAAAVEAMIRSVQTTVALMPPRVRAAIELALNADEETSYADLSARLSARCGSVVTVSAFRQRVARGMRDLERAVQERLLACQAVDHGRSKSAV
jgi:hypothetical protein